MIHARPDYQRIQDPAGLIPEDEPVFLIRAKDLTSGDAVRAWADLAERAGAAPTILTAARAHAGRMDAWRTKQIPDMPADDSEPAASGPLVDARIDHPQRAHERAAYIRSLPERESRPMPPTSEDPAASGWRWEEHDGWIDLYQGDHCTDQWRLTHFNRAMILREARRLRGPDVPELPEVSDAG